ncbi:hypothetical protein Kpol_480p4 [Vanderwaltozyma polyspora DSM 70294]|uniref:SIS domain-containing protein n=1 Tax=Vanderwaltozyma polyspora (strain ATCC 22028 / DSM 70294 / BCRC 21397 / CBS 2163 / NBRC 10782 / NRRL Y-8283 / UCD 57-17) TaxID=436907 RepID=A7TP66_VANPO|nr:uncharacterized protein Kpol_480p4 [Vanderwaltozyma polyspora DSM 70294]EDO15917.1 hypothetical protein Kpol_480p4 [Vanderwaltozyma polyspora DSM 70294]
MLNSFRELLYHNCAQIQYLLRNYYEDEETCKDIENIIEISSKSLKTGGKVIIVGCGKSYKIASKIVVMLNSLGMSSTLLHPIEAIHGDMGVIREGDVIWMCSHGGETLEVIKFIELVHKVWSCNAITTIGITSKEESTVSRICDHKIVIKQYIKEDILQRGLKTPTISTSSMLIVLDCIVMSMSEVYYNYDYESRLRFFNKNHPGGSIGFQLENDDTDKDKTRVVDKDDWVGTSEICISGDESNQMVLEKSILYDYIIIRDKIRIPSICVQNKYKEFSNNGW